MLRAYFDDDITVLYSNGFDAYNEPLATIDVEMKAYVDWKSHLISSIPSEQVIASPQISSGIVYVMAERALTHKDKIKIGTIKYAILDVRTGKDFSSNHQEIHLQ